MDQLANEADAPTDYYVLRLYGSHEGLRWIAVNSRLAGSPVDAFLDAWPNGTYQGPCRREPVSMLVPLSDLPADDVCGRTEGHVIAATWSHEVTWTCEGCLIPDATTRGISLYAVVGSPSGTVPTWDVFADVGG